MTPTSMLNNKSRPSAIRILIRLTVLSATFAVIFWSTTAQAAITHLYTGQSFGPAGTGLGAFANPIGVAVDQNSGDVFVYDAGNGGRVYKFDATGEPVNFSALASNVIEGIGGTFGAEAEIAVDSSAGPDAGDIYVANNNVVRIYSAAGSLLGELSGGEMCGVAVDSSGAVYVGIYPETARKYAPVTNPVTNADETDSIGGLNEVCNVATDSEGNFYAATYSGGITRYDALQFGSLAATGTVVDERGRTLAVDPSSNDVYVNDVPSISQYDSSGSLLANFGAGELSESFGIAVKSGGGDLYAPAATNRVDVYGPAVLLPDATTQVASSVTETAATIRGSVNPNGIATTYQFEYGTSTEYGSVSPASPENVGSDSSSHSLSVELNGLTPATTYHYRILATNANGTTRGVDATFRTKVPPLVDGESFSGVGSSSAKLSAQVNDFGFISTYYYEYGTSASYGSATQESTLGAANGDTAAPALLEGLQTNTVYHYRVVVTNEAGTVHGVDAQFKTQPARALGLPDERVYEMVTPPNNDNANVYVPGDGSDLTTVFTDLPFQSSLDGTAVAYAADPTSGGNGSSGIGEGNEYVATRSEAGWTQVNAQPAGVRSAPFQAFSSDLSLGFLESTEALAAAAPERYDVLYTRELDGGTYTPLVTSRPPNRSRVEFGTADRFGRPQSLVYAGVSSDDKHVLFEANDALTPFAETHPPSIEENDLYDSAGGKLNMVNVLPGEPGTAAPNATFGSRWPAGTGIDFNRVVSSDGSRIFWTDLNTGNLYVREDSGSETARTVQVDASVGGGGAFWTAANTGSLAFFTKSGDLYAFDTHTNQTTDLAPAGQILGVVDASEDGSHVYYVAEAVLANGASAGQPNLYLSRHSGAGWAPPVFITTLSPGDYTHQTAGNVGVWFPVLGARTAEATPDGHSLVFVSFQQLTGYDNNGQQEVYVYDSDAGELICASCDRSGEGPPAHHELLPVTENEHYMMRWISADGSRVFFNDQSALVPEDTNGRQDVYEWERDGAGDCRLENGCQYLLSGGSSTAPSYFIGASLSGDDVFIVTRAQLAAADQNETVDLYDARVGGTRQPSLPACTGSGCQGVPPAPPVFATPSSVTFNGVGNFAPPAKSAVKRKSKLPTRAQRLAKALKACAKKQKPKRAACRTLARKRYGAKSKATKSTKGRK